MEACSCGIDTLEGLFLLCHDTIVCSFDLEAGSDLLRGRGGSLLATIIDWSSAPLELSMSSSDKSGCCMTTATGEVGVTGLRFVFAAVGCQG